ncbi:MAG: hypothetical protein ABI336_09745 [Humibacillus sp.]
MSDIPDERTLEVEARAREVRLQEIINGLVRDGGRSQTEVVLALTDALEREGLGPMPEPWVEAVADEVARGNPYVVSAHARQETDVPQSSSDTPSETIT